MKNKVNKNLIVFMVCAVFIVNGIFSMTVLRPVVGSIFRLIRGEFNIEDVKNTIELTLTDELTYHDEMVSLNGIKENFVGTRVIQKDDGMVVKTDSGSLIEVVDKIDENEIFSIVKTIEELKNISENNGAEFMYCAAPQKELFETAPSNVDNYFQNNYKLFLDFLAKEKVQYIDLSNALIDEGISASDMFYYTDHHWKAYSGFVAAETICKELNMRYGFEYDKNYTNIDNYNIENYKDWFLGSKGKKVGTFFTWEGADDFELITPKFKTDMVEEQPAKKQIRKGTFEETVLYLENMEKDYYNINTYATYSGGDFRLQIMKNNLNTEGKKILLIRDSYACVVAPFLALQASELHICDVRDYDYYTGDKLNMKEYIENIKPDYVLVLYTGIKKSSDSRYNFF